MKAFSVDSSSTDLTLLIAILVERTKTSYAGMFLNIEIDQSLKHFQNFSNFQVFCKDHQKYIFLNPLLLRRSFRLTSSAKKSNFDAGFKEIVFSIG